MRRALLSIGLVLALGGAGTAQTPLPTKRVLTLEAARRMTAAAEAEARKNSWAVSIAVLDDRG